MSLDPLRDQPAANLLQFGQAGAFLLAALFSDRPAEAKGFCHVGSFLDLLGGDRMVFRRVYNATLGEIHGLVLNNTGGLVYASPRTSSPSVVFETQSSKLLLSVSELVSHELRLLSLTLDRSTDSSAYSLKIYMPSYSLQYLETVGGGDAVVHGNTLNQDALMDLSIVSRGSGNILVDVDAIEADDVVVAAHSSGSIQLVVRHAFVANSIDLVSHRTGSVALLPGALATTVLATTSMRSGNVVVGGLSSNRPVISTEKLVVKALGSGFIEYLSHGACNASSVETYASGAAYTHLVVCQHSTAKLRDAGDIYVSSVQSLATQTDGSGSVYANLDVATRATGRFTPMPLTVALPTYEVLSISEDSRRAGVSVGTVSFWLVLSMMSVTVLIVIALVGYKQLKPVWSSYRSRAKRGVTKTEFTPVSTPKTT
ncbi:hypothetical protein AeMF1_015568 [Aphanomyces euteiches]|nr:hypothetical protein AeMF1_015568 [Aphanomyces euteiches]